MRTIDDELRQRFAELREADRENMPEFGAIAERARSPEPRRWKSTLTWAAAAAVLIVSFAIGMRWRSQTPAPDPSLTISTWRSPTASLLPTSLPNGFVQSSALGSVLDGLTYRGE